MRGKCELLKITTDCSPSVAWTSADLLVMFESCIFAIGSAVASGVCIFFTAIANYSQYQLITDLRKVLLECLDKLRTINNSDNHKKEKNGSYFQVHLSTSEQSEIMLQTILKVKLHLSEYKRVTSSLSIFTATFFMIGLMFVLISLVSKRISSQEMLFIKLLIVAAVFVTLNLASLLCAELHSRLENLEKLFWSISSENLVRQGNRKALSSGDFVSALWLKMARSARREWPLCAARPFGVRLTHNSVIGANFLFFSALSLYR